MREEQIVLEDDADRAALGRQMDAARDVVQDDVVELDPTGMQRDDSGERAK